jgi:hypothetical protein
MIGSLKTSTSLEKAELDPGVKCDSSAVGPRCSFSSFLLCYPFYLLCNKHVTLCALEETVKAVC